MDSEQDDAPQPKFTPRQGFFIREYCKDFNATQASIRAGYSVDTAAEMGYENLNKPHIKQLIDKKIKEINATAHIDAVWALNQRLEILQRSIERNDSAGANAALHAVEKLHLGMAEKIESKNKNMNMSIDVPLTDADREILKRLGWRNDE